MKLPRSVSICEVGPRDGFQMEPEFISTESKIRVIDMLSSTGLREIQATAFVHPRAIPQLQDAEAVMAGIKRVPGITYSALVPNERGAERAVGAAADRIDAVVSVSRSHSLANTNMEPKQALERAGSVARIAAVAGISASIGFATALGCPFEGFLPSWRVDDMVAEAVESHGFTTVAIADTAGMADPRLVHSTMSRLIGRFPAVDFGLHLHDTRRMGLANVLAGLEAGVTRFDSSIAGLGGCPYSPGATGNIATEDLVNMLAGMKVKTGIAPEELVVVGRFVGSLVGHTDSGVMSAGTSAKVLGPFEGTQRKVGTA